MKVQLRAAGREKEPYKLDVEVDDAGVLSYFCGCRGFVSRRTCKHVIALLIGDLKAISGADDSIMEAVRKGIAGTALEGPVEALARAERGESGSGARPTKGVLKKLLDALKQVVPTHAVGGSVRTSRAEGKAEAGGTTGNVSSTAAKSEGPAVGEVIVPLPSDVVFLDTETTGLSVEHGDRIVEISIVDEAGSVLLDTLVDPEGRQSHPEAFAKHQLEASMLIGKPTIRELGPRIRELTRGKLVVAYNIDFDRKFLGDALSDAGAFRCAMNRFNNVTNGVQAKLEAAVEHIGYQPEGDFHRARADALACRALWIWMDNEGLPVEYTAMRRSASGLSERVATLEQRLSELERQLARVTEPLVG